MDAIITAKNAINPIKELEVITAQKYAKFVFPIIVLQETLFDAKTAIVYAFR